MTRKNEEQNEENEEGIDYLSEGLEGKMVQVSSNGVF
jgi:hypothetical protein